jgi:hypothetical protein
VTRRSRSTVHALSAKNPAVLMAAQPEDLRLPRFGWYGLPVQRLHGNHLLASHRRVAAVLATA